MDLNLKLLKKIHEDAGGKSHIAITRDWSDEVPELKYQDRTFYDQLYTIDGFINASKRMIDNEVEDTYFSINSFRRREKQTSRVWHLNAFVLDFDYYKIDKYKDLSAMDMYDRHIKDELDFQPTAVVDSGRGLYVVYSFKHACKSMIPTYKAIYKTFHKKLAKYGMDQNAMNVTQIIRIPGTFNPKSFTPVEVLEFNDTNYELKNYFEMFKYTREEVASYKSKLSDSKRNVIVNEVDLEKRCKFRDEISKGIITDLKKLIEMRNAEGVHEGYREILIYIARKRMKWKDSSLQKELEVAHELNNTFTVPLSSKEIENNCMPYGMTRCCSIKTILRKLNITKLEQKQLRVLRTKSIKDSERIKRQRLIKLLNLTEKQKNMLERRTRIAQLKDEGKRNSEIAMILTLEKSMVTRDLDYIRKNAWKFYKKLQEAMKELQSGIKTTYFTRNVRYDEQQSLLEWLKISEILLE